MIRAEDLMIGDLLTFAECVNDKDYPVIKVTGILEDTLFACIGDSKGEDEVGYEDLAGIPLTPEILEKNGWIRDEICNEWNISKGLHLFGECPNIGTFDGVSIHYVHQLQHALKLCGIEKEIVL